MGTFDIGAGMEEGQALTIAGLCQELMDEYEEQNPGKDAPALETIRNKFKNHDRSGLIDKLKDNLGFRVEEIAECSPQAKYEELKLLKSLYYIEKADKKAANSKIRITDILAKPRLENVGSDLAPKSKYSELFEALLSDVGREVPHAAARLGKIDGMIAYWEYVTEKVFDYVITDKALENPELAERELERIDGYLETKVLARLNEFPKETEVYHDGVFETFHTILCCHRALCDDADRININYRICISSPPTPEYVEQFRMAEQFATNKVFIDMLSNTLNGNISEDRGVSWSLALISYGEDITDEDIEHYKFALKHYEIIIRWIEKKWSIDLSKEVDLALFVTIMQELISVSKERETWNNDYYGNKYTKRSILNAVKKPMQAEPVVIKLWLEKIRNRLAVNFGSYSLISKKRRIENKVYEIKSKLFSMQNLDDLSLANNLLCRFVARSIMSRDLAMNIGTSFASQVIAAMKDDEARERMRFICDDRGINAYDMFREFAIDSTGVMELVAEDVAHKITEFYQDTEHGSLVSQEMCSRFETAYKTNPPREFIFTYYVDRVRHEFLYHRFFEVRSDEWCDKMISLNLGGFIRR